MEELKFFDTLTNDVDALEVESLELLHPVVVPHLLLPYHYPTPPPTQRTLHWLQRAWSWRFRCLPLLRGEQVMNCSACLNILH